MPIAKNTLQVRRRETQHFTIQAAANPQFHPPDSYQRIRVLCFTALTGNAV